MKAKRLAMLVAALAVLPSAWAFVYLTPNNLQGRKLYEGELNQWNFEREAPLVTAYAPKGFFQPILRDSLRRMGGEVFERVAFDPADTPDYFRLRAGFFVAILFACDGAYLPEGDKLPEPYAKAFALAREDQRVVARFRALVEKGMAGKDLIVESESRRALQWMDGLWNWRDLTPDDLRFEFGAWIRRLEAIMGEPHGPAPKALGSVGGRPDYEIPATLGKIPLEASSRGVKLDPAGRVSFSGDLRGFSLSFSTSAVPCRVSLTVDTGAHPRFRYDVVLGAEKLPPPPGPLPPRAPFPARGLMNGVEPQFGGPSDWRNLPHEVYSRAYPNPCFGWRGRVLSGSLARFGERAPMGVVRRSCRWRVTVEKDGATVCDAVLEWPRGSAASIARLQDGVIGRYGLEASWQEAVNALNARFCTSQLEKGFRFAKVDELCFEIGDVESDELFWQAYAKRFWQVRPTKERLATLTEDVVNARREFLAHAYAGGPFRQRVPDKAKSAIEAATEPNADIGALDDLTLEDE